MADETTTSGGTSRKKNTDDGSLKEGQREFAGQIQDAPTTENSGQHYTADQPIDAERYTNSSAQTKTIEIEVAEDIDPGLLAMTLRQLAPRRAPLVGNFADLQRMGAAQLAGEDNPVEAAVIPPPQRDGDATATVSFEDTVAPGPSGVPADVAEELYGSRVAQGERPENVETDKK